MKPAEVIALSLADSPWAVTQMRHAEECLTLSKADLEKQIEQVAALGARMAWVVSAKALSEIKDEKLYRGPVTPRMLILEWRMDLFGGKPIPFHISTAIRRQKPVVSSFLIHDKGFAGFAREYQVGSDSESSHIASEAMTAEAIYAVQVSGDGPIKIGYSRSVHTRLQSLQTGSPYRLIELGTWVGSRADEQRIHAALSAHRLQGEWFEPHADVLAAIRKAQI